MDSAHSSSVFGLESEEQRGKEERDGETSEGASEREPGSHSNQTETFSVSAWTDRQTATGSFGNKRRLARSLARSPARALINRGVCREQAVLSQDGFSLINEAAEEGGEVVMNKTSQNGSGRWQ